MTEYEDTWHYHSRVSTQHHYIAVATPKVACTTIKRALHEFEGLARTERLALDHDAGEELRLSRYSASAIADMLASPDWLKFTFVRNPYDRMLSAWKSKILAPWDTQYAPLRAAIREAFGYPGGVEDSPVVVFGDFVRYITSSTDRAVTHDGHWERQTVVGAHDVIPYDVIGRFESFRDDFAAILDRLDAPANVRELATQVTNPTVEIPMAAAYHSDIAEIVYDYYRDDFERFGYARDSWYQPKPISP